MTVWKFQPTAVNTSIHPARYWNVNPTAKFPAKDFYTVLETWKVSTGTYQTFKLESTETEEFVNGITVIFNNPKITRYEGDIPDNHHPGKSSHIIFDLNDISDNISLPAE